MNIVILCGGNGTRLWPLSRTKLPKQFLSLTNDKTMFQNTVLRFQHLKPLNIQINQYIIICNKEHSYIVDEQIKALNLTDKYTIICEPIGRDSAPAVCIASLFGEEEDTTLIVPCDHIFNDEELCKLIYKGVNQYIDNAIITFGVKPTYPEIGYGYIETNPDYKTVRFREKPDEDTATSYIENGNYLWNAGLFMFNNNTMINCFKKYASEILNVCKNTLDISKTNGITLNLDEELFKTCKSISIDYAIMEPLSLDKSLSVSAYTLPYTYKWSDIGSFKSLFEESEKDTNENVIKCDTTLHETTSCYIDSDIAHVTMLGVNNLVVINHRDTLLIADKEHSQDVKKIVNTLPETKQDLKFVHAKAFRPWGWYINVEGGDYSGYKVKRIGVYPGKRLSLQSHNQRCEHWVIIKGKARVQLNNNFIDMGPNDHTYIPKKSLHRMENIGSEMVEFIETQIGEYLGEDDIIRYEDDFGRI